MTIYSLDVLFFLFGTSLLFHVLFKLLLPDLYIGFSRGRSGGLVFPSLDYYLHIKKIEIMPFAATWMDLDSVILREISQTEKEKKNLSHPLHVEFK